MSEAGTGESHGASPINDQVADAVAQIDELLTVEAGSGVSVIAYQSMVHTVALAMQNAVAQQQQAYILRNAATTAAVRSLLEEDPQKALEIAFSSFPGESVDQTLDGLKSLMDEITQRLEPDKEPATGSAKAARKASPSKSRKSSTKPKAGDS